MRWVKNVNTAIRTNTNLIVSRWKVVWRDSLYFLLATNVMKNLENDKFPRRPERLWRWCYSVCVLIEMICCILENVESQILGNIRQKGHKYKRAVWRDFQAGKIPRTITSAKRGFWQEEKEKMLHLLRGFKKFMISYWIIITSNM